MVKLVNRARMTTATTGTGTVTLGAAVGGFQSFSDAGVSDADQVRYVIEDGNNWEIGLGTYTASGTTLSRTPSESSNAGAAITLSGTAEVYVTAAGEDLATAAQGIKADAAMPTTGGTFTGDVAFDAGIKEAEYTITGTTPVLDPSNGTIQVWTLTGNSTPTTTLSSGESMVLMVDDGTGYALDFNTSVVDTWLNASGSQPTLATSGYNSFVRSNVGGTIFAYVPKAG